MLVTARRDAYVAGFPLLDAMGQAEAKDLNLDGGPLYDPTVNYNRVQAPDRRLGQRCRAAAGGDPNQRHPAADPVVTPDAADDDPA